MLTKHTAMACRVYLLVDDSPMCINARKQDVVICCLLYLCLYMLQVSFPYLEIA